MVLGQGPGYGPDLGRAWAGSDMGLGLGLGSKPGLRPVLGLRPVPGLQGRL